jgi:hypothetical protein
MRQNYNNGYNNRNDYRYDNTSNYNRYEYIENYTRYDTENYNRYEYNEERGSNESDRMSGEGQERKVTGRQQVSRTHINSLVNLFQEALQTVPLEKVDGEKEDVDGKKENVDGEKEDRDGENSNTS